MTAPTAREIFEFFQAMTVEGDLPDAWGDEEVIRGLEASNYLAGAMPAFLHTCRERSVEAAVIALGVTLFSMGREFEARRVELESLNSLYAKE